MEDVEDLTAETFARAWQGRLRFRGDEAAATGWLITIARHLVIDAHRQRREPPDPIADCELATPPELSVERQVERNEEQAELLAALHTLPMQERELVILHYMLGWPVKRIAAHYGLLENTVSVKLRRALDSLRRQWPDAREVEP